jgi:nicotinate phosphoribosyltransferase
MRGGRRIGPRLMLADIRAHASRELARLPESLHRLEPAAPFPVQVAAPLVRLAAEVDRRLAGPGAQQ